MKESLDKIEQELQLCGYTTYRQQTPQGEVVAFLYKVEVGSQKGNVVHLGFSMSEVHYPDYPPHWIHVHPPVNDGQGGAINQYQDNNGRDWSALSRPGADVWDNAKTKHMSVYMQEHVRRFWNKI